MASRFHQRDSRSSLFSAYDSQSRSRPPSQSPAPPRSNYNYAADPGSSNAFAPPAPQNGQHLNAFSAYPAAADAEHRKPGSANSGGAGGFRSGEGLRDDGFRPATPNRKGQYSDAVLNELESQNEEQLQGMSRKVRMLKDITVAIGDEIRDSTAFAEKMNDQFDGTSVRLRGTMNRMLRMAERTGIGWRVWLLFFAAITLLF
ncbi:protein transport protein bet1, partial [Elasticomyces elasticus]